MVTSVTCLSQSFLQITLHDREYRTHFPNNMECSSSSKLYAARIPTITGNTVRISPITGNVVVVVVNFMLRVFPQ